MDKSYFICDNLKVYLFILYLQLNQTNIVVFVVASVLNVTNVLITARHAGPDWSCLKIDV